MCSDGLDAFLKGRLKTRIKVFKNGLSWPILSFFLRINYKAYNEEIRKEENNYDI